jgi:TetR/AcrR family transcriptional repressor of mexJK operon
MTQPLAQTRTRREARRQSRREAILEVAAQSFLENGYAGTTMSAIATRLGGSKGTLWSYFASKELLFGAVIENATEVFRAQLSLILNPRDAVDVALRRFCEEYMRKVTSPQAIRLHQLVVGEASRFPEVGRIFHDRAPRMTHRLLADYLDGAMTRGLLRREDPLCSAQQLIALCMASCHQPLLFGVSEEADAPTIRREVDSAMRTFMAAYAV